MKKQIDDILLEWAMRSPDGLAMGHYTDENVKVLEEVLKDMNLPKQSKEEKAKEKAAQKRESERAGDPYPEKDYKPVSISFSIEKLIRKNKNDVKWIEFFRSRDKASTIEDAMKLYNRTDKSVVSALNSIKTSQSRAGLGRGEVALVWFLKGAQHGGVETGDIIIGEQTIDVKEMSGELKGNIGIERNSFKGFNQNKFISDLSDLINILWDKNVRNYIKSNILNVPDINKYLSEKDLEYTNQFLDSFDMGKFGKRTIKGINYIGKKVLELKNSPDKGTTVISVFNHGEKHTAAVNNPIKVVDTMKQVEQPEDAGKIEKTPLEVKPVDRKDESISISKLLRARFFHTEWTEESMWNELSKSLHYTGIVIVSKRGLEAVDYVKKRDFSKKFAFRGIAKGITISYPKQSEESVQGSVQQKI